MQEQLDAISELTSGSMAAARGIAYRLRPFELDQLGLKAALEVLVTDTCHSANLRVFHDFTALPEDLTPTQKLHLFRFVQEGLLNVVHHAHAATVMLEVKVDAGQVMLQIDDGGVGFDRAVISQVAKAGLGLARMAEHAKALGGQLEVVSAPGRGTKLRWIAQAP